MAEGGLLSWKRQVIKTNGPTADYSNLKTPLPNPPEDYEWIPEDNWKLVRKEDQNKIDDSDNNKINQEFDHDFDSESVDQKLMPSDRSESNCREYEKKLANLKKKNGSETNIDYVEHLVIPTDTFSGLCLKYKVPATMLRQVNCFSGSNLKLAPSKLIIPVNKKLLGQGKIVLQDRNSVDFKINLFLMTFPDMRRSEAKTYLHLADNDIDNAIAEARADIQWEKSQREQQQQAEAHDLNLLVVDTQKMKDGDQIAVAIPVDRDDEDKN